MVCLKPYLNLNRIRLIYILFFDTFFILLIENGEMKKLTIHFLGTKEPEFIEKYISIWRNISKPVLAKNFNEEILIISGRTMKMVIERTAQFGQECKKF